MLGASIDHLEVKFARMRLLMLLKCKATLGT